MSGQTRQPQEPGETNRNVVSNIERLRKDRRLSLRDLSKRLGAIGRPILPTPLHRQSQGGRRVDVDDLVAFAAVLGVTPADLLAPPGEATMEPDSPAARAALDLARRIRDLCAEPGEPAAGYVGRSLRRVQVEVEELLAETSQNTGSQSTRRTS